MIYGSVCSGIEAATVAWEPLGWKPAFFSEIDAFPASVLRHHYGTNTLAFDLKRKSQHERRPGAPWNFGDFTTIRPRTLRRLGVPAIDVLVGGTPCQAFSIAGDRLGLDDPRGNLTLEFLVLVRRLRPRWFVWENVPGVLSIDEGRTFGALLGAVGQLGYGFAYRVLDAQYFGVPQRRRRVFVVGHLGAWQRAAAVLFEAESLRRDSPPRRESREDVARPLAASAAGGSGYRNDADTADNLIAHPLLAKGNCSNDSTLETYITHSLTGEGFDASEDGTGRGTPLVAFGCKASGRNGFGIGETAPTLRAMGHRKSHNNAGGHVAVAFDLQQITSPGNRSNPKPGDPAPALTINTDQVVAFHGSQDPDVSGDVTHPLGTNGGLEACIAYPIQDPNNPNKAQGGPGIGSAGEPAYTLQAEQQHGVAVAFQERGRGGVRNLEISEDVAYALTSRESGGATDRFNIATPSAVRRLTPRECERLQGFPDDYTAIPVRGGVAPDGPRYRGLGNSMAVPVMRWIGERIDAVDKIPQEDAAPQHQEALR